ncbi:methionyl-tRNA synthetase [Polymorphobacter fuscus]|uniref:Methionine--tRNA ligase n=2 Tax=Sandarakinorhabdus fusca TaxID=1439888 RepID=A0A7C9KVI0_9SPHN|nr:methionine--tRNA ligase [Polymorphobacter fuscus]MQT16245.1 methionine--tRNA ligase [Polymorphobacter fuscus]NJC07470.1 methionyl-tRNA synthetase [Polymorphobacter fuscus]
MNPRFYITTAIAYPNGKPHMGHAYEAIATDAIARFKRLDGFDVRFLTGTDEHGLKIAQAARVAGIEPRAYVDATSQPFIDLDRQLGISFDRFIRTTDADHKDLCQALWDRMAANGDLYLGRYEGWYSVRDEAYYDEAELIAGEDAEGRAVKLSPQGTAVEWTVEESWFFKLSAYAEPLLAHYAAHPDFIQPASRFNEMRSFVSGGLSDLSMSRTSFDWGIPVPGSPGHVMYVWVDALANYLTGAGGLEGEWWPADLHVIGKDVVRFHAVYWPAFLMSARLALPKTVFGHGFVLNRGVKMSKSDGNVVDPAAMAERFGVDRLRWFLLREVAFGEDGSYSDEAIIERTNADLANGIGNLAQRALSMVAKNLGGAMPGSGASEGAEPLSESLDTLTQAYFGAMAGLQLNRALEAVMAMVNAANGYFADNAPWKLAKTDVAAMGHVLQATLDATRRIVLLTQPFVPEASARLLDQLGVAPDARQFSNLGDVVAAGTQLPDPQGVFPRWSEAAA